MMGTAPQGAAPSRPVRELHTHADWPKARVGDADSPRDLALAFFAAISAPKGGKLDRERLRSLFVPDGRIEVPLVGEAGQATDVVFLTPDEYADSSDRSTAESGFFDHMIAAHVQRFGVMAHVWTSYESRNRAEDAKPFVRGVKSFEVMESGGRWYIANVAWDRERAGVGIPAGLLKDSEE
jgi:hypothetical protein